VGTETPFCSASHGRHEVPSSISIRADNAGEVLVTFQNRYSQLPDEAPLVGILGDQMEQFFRQAFELKIVGDKLPEAHAQDILNELQEVFGKYNALDALEVKAGIKPLKEFHAARHLSLTPEQNLRIEEACPIIAMVKTKGRK